MAFALVAQLLPIVTASSTGWSTFESAGMEYLFDDEKVTYSTAASRCAAEDPPALLASPNTEEANDFIYNLASPDGSKYQSRFIGLQNVAGSCDESDMVFQWDTLVVRTHLTPPNHAALLLRLF